MIILELFISFLQVGLFSVGGGYAAMPLIQAQTVTLHPWLTMNEFTDLITIAEMTPGPIAVNSATFVGLRIAGIPGAIVATLGCIFPSLIIVSIMSHFYYKYRSSSGMQSVLEGLRPAIVALISCAAISIFTTAVFSGAPILLENVNWLAVALFVAALVALKKFKLNPILVMMGCGVINLLVGLITGAV